MKKKHIETKTASRIKARQIDNDEVKRNQVQEKARLMKKARHVDNENVKKKQVKATARFRKKARLADNEIVKEQQRVMSRLSRCKKKLTDPKKLQQDEMERQRKHRKVETRSDRLREFREATKYNAIFLCICCQQRMFESNVRLYTDKLRNEINGIKHDHVDSCVEDVLKTKTFIGGEGYDYICLTCVRHMKRGKVPPMSAMNRLQLHEEDKDIKHQKLDLTELEGALIAKNIIFQKIYQLPKSRWTALKDRLINIPIMDDDIMNTIEQIGANVVRAHARFPCEGRRSGH